MSTMALDQSLDTIIADKKKSLRRPKTKAAAKKKVSSASTAKKGARAAIVGTTKAVKPVTAPSVLTGNKINISNLPPDVKEAEIRELFASTIGNVREVALHFDSHGKSKGIASVIFHKKEDASKAVAQYHNRLIDGTRQMKIELVLNAGTAPVPPTLAERVAPAKPAKEAAPKAVATKKAAPKKKVVRRSKRTPKTPVTAADLDAQMEDYSAAAAQTIAA